MPLGEREAELLERVAVLEQIARAVQEDVRELLAKLDGPPWERSVRGRLHHLEADGAAAKIAAHTLAEAQAERRRARGDLEKAREASWSWRWKALAGATSLAVAVSPYVAIFYGRG